jgi:hypothetical protein
MSKDCSPDISFSQQLLFFISSILPGKSIRQADQTIVARTMIAYRVKRYNGNIQMTKSEVKSKSTSKLQNE